MPSPTPTTDDLLQAILEELQYISFLLGPDNNVFDKRFDQYIEKSKQRRQNYKDHANNPK